MKIRLVYFTKFVTVIFGNDKKKKLFFSFLKFVKIILD